MIDCLLIGPNIQPLDVQIHQAEAQGLTSEYYQTLNLSFIHYDNKPMRPLELINHIRTSDGGSQIREIKSAKFIQTAILHLGTYLSRAGFTFDYIGLFQNEKEILKEKLLKNEILTVGISTTLYGSPDPIYEIIDFIRTYNRETKIVLGGPYIYSMTVSLRPAMIKQFLQKSGADFLVINSEGEEALTNIIRGLKGLIPFDRIDNIVYQEGSEYVITEQSPENQPLTNPIDYHLFPPERLNQALNLRFSKSCPFSCAYCSFPSMAGKYQKMGMDDIERQLDQLKERGIRYFDIVDDTLNTPIKRFKEFLQLLIRKKYHFEWSCYFRCCKEADELAHMMVEAGCKSALLGVESGSDTVLKTMNKKITRAQAESTIIALQRAGVSSIVSLIIGFPSETRETIRETTEMLKITKPDFYRNNLWFCHPLAPIWQKRKKYGIKGSSFNWMHDTMNAKQAYEYILEQMAEVTESLYYPEGEMINLFHLLRYGWRIGQVKTYLRAFNTVLSHKLPNADPMGLNDAYAALRQSIPSID